MSFEKSIVRDLTACSWLLFISLFFLSGWDPLTPHPLTLFIKGFSSFFLDIPAAFVKIAHNGMHYFLFFIIFGCASAGAGAFSLMPAKKLFTPGRYLLFSVSVGMAIISYYTFALGLLKGFNAEGLVVSWIFLGACALFGAVVSWRTLQAHFRQSCVSYGPAAFFCLLFIIIAFLFAKSLWPNVFYDAIVYHLGVPNYYLQEGAIIYIPYDAFSNFPFLTELTYTLGLFLAGLQGAQVISVFIFLILIFSVYDFSRTFLPDIPAWLPALFCIAAPGLMDASIMCSNDLSSALYMLLGIACFFEWEKSANPRWLMLAGCFAGLCACMKYTALIFVPILAATGIGYVVWNRRQGFLRPCTRCALCFVIPACIIFSPWLIRNFIWTGNPFYPAFYPLLGGSDMTPEQYIVVNQLSNPPNFKEIIRGLWQHPLMLSFGRPEVFLRYGYQWNIGPLILLFAPLLLLLRGISKVVKKLAFAGLLFFLLWNATFIVSRFLYPAIVIMLIVSAYAAATLIRTSVFSLKIFISCITACYLFLCIVIGFQQVNRRTMSQGFDYLYDTDDKFLRKHMIDDAGAVLNSYPVYSYINDNLSPNALVLIIADAQHLYIQRRHRYAYLSATTPYDVFKQTAGDCRAAAQALKKQGITHIVYNPIEMVRLQEAGALAYAKKDNTCIDTFLRGPFVKRIYSYKRYARADNDKDRTLINVDLFELK